MPTQMHALSNKSAKPGDTEAQIVKMAQICQQCKCFLIYNYYRSRFKLLGSLTLATMSLNDVIQAL
jgi:hypothetical protein